MFTSERERHDPRGRRDRTILIETLGYYGLLGAAAVGTLFLR